MEIHIYGKQGCGLCESAMKKTEVLLEKWGEDGRFPVKMVDMETPEGAAEGDYFDVFDVPAVFVMEDHWTVAQRWDGHAPPSEGLYATLKKAS